MLVRSLGHRGLALGTAMAALLNAGVLLVAAARAAGRPRGRPACSTACVKISLASVAMAFAAYYAERAPARSVRQATTSCAQAVRVFGAIGIGMVVLAVSAHVLRIEEFTAAQTPGFARPERGRFDVMRRYPSRGPSYSSFSFGPGPLSPAIKSTHRDQRRDVPSACG